MRQDILFGDVEGAYDLLIQSGDFVLDLSIIQETLHIIEAEQEAFKQVPLVGIGVRRMLSASLTGTEKHLILKQLEGDDIIPSLIRFIEGKIVVRL